VLAHRRRFFLYPFGISLFPSNLKYIDRFGYSDGVAEQLEKIVTALKGLVTEIAVVNYSDKTA